MINTGAGYCPGNFAASEIARLPLGYRCTRLSGGSKRSGRRQVPDLAWRRDLLVPAYTICHCSCCGSLQEKPACLDRWQLPADGRAFLLDVLPIGSAGKAPDRVLVMTSTGSYGGCPGLRTALGAKVGVATNKWGTYDGTGNGLSR
jgi:hypothetical protein